MSDADSLSYEWALKQAADRNCTIEHADDKTLQLDLDSEAAYEVYLKQVVRLRELELLPVDVTLDEFASVRRSRSGNRHVIIKLFRPLPAEERIMLQALLGSDPVREALSLARVRAGNLFPILLFVPKPVEEVVVSDNDLPF